jgi:hypothetical protein
MHKTIELHKVLASHLQERPVHESFATDTDDVGENPGIAPAAPVDAAPVEKTVPVTVFVDSIRCFNPRREDKAPGTRLTFKDGGGFAVSETYGEVQTLLAA